MQKIHWKKYIAFPLACLMMTMLLPAKDVRARRNNEDVHRLELEEMRARVDRHTAMLRAGLLDIEEAPVEKPVEDTSEETEEKPTAEETESAEESEATQAVENTVETEVTEESEEAEEADTEEVATETTATVSDSEEVATETTAATSDSEEVVSNETVEEESVAETEEEIVEEVTEEVESTSDEEPEGNTEAPYLYSLEDLQWLGVINWEGYKFTYYSQSVLPGEGLNIPGRHVNEAGYVADEDGYIVLANDAPNGTIIPTPFGYYGKVYDAGTYGNHFDVYTK